MRALGSYVPVLEERYAECDKKGHLKPNPKENRCMHCYRTLEIGIASDVEKDAQANLNLPRDQQRMDAVSNKERQEAYVAKIRSDDRMRGLSALLKENNGEPYSPSKSKIYY